MNEILAATLKQYAEQVNLLVAFVEGNLDAEILEKALEGEAMESLLGPTNGLNKTVPFYEQLLFQGLSSLGGQVNTEGIIENFLTLVDVPYKSARRYGKVYRLILSALPDHVDPPLAFLMEKIIPNDSELSDSKKKLIIKERLKKAFPYANKPPRWLQSAEWPIENDVPLLFIGQLKISAPNYFHDDGMAYLFFNAESGSFETITQFY
ncbi:MAG: hypothetical protein WBP13_06400 [Methylophilaceae bacterium]